ncbi:MAG: hypothetical protein V9F06_08760 [Thermomicrobiales bacterium]
MERTFEIDPAITEEIIALGSDLGLSNELGALRLVFYRLMESAGDACDRQLVQNITSIATSIARMVQYEARRREGEDRWELDREISRALDELDEAWSTRDDEDPFALMAMR